MHNNIMAAGSKDRPPMLGPGRYSQWRSRFLRYIDTKPNGEGLRKSILSYPYVPYTVLVQAVAATEALILARQSLKSNLGHLEFGLGGCGIASSALYGWERFRWMRGEGVDYPWVGIGRPSFLMDKRLVRLCQLNPFAPRQNVVPTARRQIRRIQGLEFLSVFLEEILHPAHGHG
ncbi:hypothetical protein Tco_0820626 [Tanacetum coccineum]|uniref:Uncharacterized protein n=1 Tax=Tanacetum coccineum TaxID=301880 RepID=A0ABQ5AD43_9ASTR